MESKRNFDGIDSDNPGDCGDPMDIVVDGAVELFPDIKNASTWRLDAGSLDEVPRTHEFISDESNSGVDDTDLAEPSVFDVMLKFYFLANYLIRDPPSRVRDEQNKIPWKVRSMTCGLYDLTTTDS